MERRTLENQLVALKLLLDELGLRPQISTLNDRKRLQKSVYLAQIAGVDLGYRFSWYLRGPYSPSLTRDYFALAKEIGMGDRTHEGKRLKNALREHLEKIRPLLTVPEGVDLGQPSWLELLASLHYLRQVRKESRSEAVQILEKEKPTLAPYFEKAEGKLVTAGLLAA